MSAADIIIIILAILSVGGGVAYAFIHRKRIKQGKGGCSGCNGCAGCTTSCSKRESDDKES